jgi:hypothetical protein
MGCIGKKVTRIVVITHLMVLLKFGWKKSTSSCLTSSTKLWWFLELVTNSIYLFVCMYVCMYVIFMFAPYFPIYHASIHHRFPIMMPSHHPTTPKTRPWNISLRCQPLREAGSCLPPVAAQHQPFSRSVIVSLSSNSSLWRRTLFVHWCSARLAVQSTTTAALTMHHLLQTIVG